MLGGVVVGLELVYLIPLNMYYHDNILLNKKTIEQHPDAAQSYYALASFYRCQGQLQQAIDYLKMYIIKRSQWVHYEDIRPICGIYRELGELYREDPDQAIFYFKKSIQANPRFADAYADMGKAYLLKKDYAKAKEYLQTAHSLNPQLVTEHIYSMELLNALSQPEEARALLEKAKEIFPEDRFLLQYEKSTYPQPQAGP